MANKITVKFEAQGARALKTAIDQLAVAQTRLNKSNKAAERLQAKLNKQIKNYSKDSVLATRNTRLLAGAFATLRSKLLLTAFAMNIVKNSLGSLVNLFGEQEDAEKRLEVALGGVNQELLDFASASQKVTRSGDETIISAMALIAAFVDDEEQIKAATTATLDLAAAKGMDLNSAADLVAKTLGSETNSLSRYGIQVEGAVGSTERLTSLTDSMAEAFGGQATEQAGTLAGKLDRVKNIMGDIGEDVGEKMESTLSKVTTAMLKFNDALTDQEIQEEAIKKTKEDIIELDRRIAANLENTNSEDKLDAEIDLLDQFLRKTKEAREEQLKLLTPTENTEAQAAFEQEMALIQLELDTDENKYIQKRDRMIAFRQEETALGENAVHFSFEMHKKELKAFEDKENKKKLIQLKAGQESIRILSQVAQAIDRNSGLAKAAMVAEMMVNAFMIAQKTLMSLLDMDVPFPAAFALSTAQFVAQVAQVNKAKQFETGGLVGGRRHSQGGTMIEAEQGEFVMSRDAVESIGAGTLEAMNQGGGGAITVNVSGNVMTDDFVENELAEKIATAVRRGTDFGMA
tara:strand:- start:1248 stop:2969 length:1722 start_codon:yes stop_codon:yes gene_type:complete